MYSTYLKRVRILRICILHILYAKYSTSIIKAEAIKRVDDDLPSFPHEFSFISTVSYNNATIV